MISIDVIKSMVKQAGGVYVGIQPTPDGESDLILFNDPITESTIAIRTNLASVSTIKSKLLRRRMLFHPVMGHKRNQQLWLEVKAIRKLAVSLMANMSLNKQGIKDVQNVLARLEVLEHYLRQKEEK